MRIHSLESYDFSVVIIAIIASVAMTAAIVTTVWTFAMTLNDSDTCR